MCGMCGCLDLKMGDMWMCDVCDVCMCVCAMGGLWCVMCHGCCAMCDVFSSWNLDVGFVMCEAWCVRCVARAMCDVWCRMRDATHHTSHINAHPYIHKSTHDAPIHSSIHTSTHPYVHTSTHQLPLKTSPRAILSREGLEKNASLEVKFAKESVRIAAEEMKVCSETYNAPSKLWWIWQLGGLILYI